MSFTIVRTEAVTTEDLRQFQRDEEDHEWLSAHAQEIETQWRGKFIAVANRQLFIGESRDEAAAKAKIAFPDSDPIVEYIPWKRQVQVL